MIKKFTYLLLFIIALYAPGSFAIGTQCPLGREETAICPDDILNCTDEQKVKFCKKYCPDDPMNPNSCLDSEKVRTPVTMFQKICSYDTAIFKPDKLTGNLIRCAQVLVFKGGDRLIIGYTSMFASWIHYIVILAIVFFGIKMMFGQAMEKGITLVMIAKITLVLYMTSYPGTFRLLQAKDALFQASSNLVINILKVPDNISPPPEGFFARVGSVTDFGAGITSMFCTPEGRVLAAPGTNGVPAVPFCNNKNLGTVFDDIDTLIFRLYGLTDEQASSADPKQKNFNGLIIFLVGMFFTGEIGLSLTMLFLTYFLAAAFAFGQILMLFIICMIAINFLVAIAPIALAGILFDQTKRMTKVWFSYLLTYTILPVVLAAFLWLIGIVLYGIMQEPEFLRAKEKINSSIQNMVNKNVLSKDACLNSGNKEFTYQNNSLENYLANSLTSGKATSADFGYQENGCLSLPQTQLASDGATEEEKIKLINREDLKALTSVNLGIIIFFIIIISMIKELPKMAAAIAGNAASGAADIAAKPVAYLESKIQGTGKTFGIKPSELLKKN
jgi:hypothetical protein